jgi:hypothetical protein
MMALELGQGIDSRVNPERYNWKTIGKLIAQIPLSSLYQLRFSLESDSTKDWKARWGTGLWAEVDGKFKQITANWDSSG